MKGALLWMLATLTILLVTNYGTALMVRDVCNPEWGPCAWLWATLFSLIPWSIFWGGWMVVILWTTRRHRATQTDIPLQDLFSPDTNI